MSDTNTKKSEDTSIRILPIIITLVTALIGAPTLYSVISDIFFSPNITMDFLVDNLTTNNIILEVKNIGNELATHFSLTIESPYNISGHDLFLTENSTNIKESLLEKKHCKYLFRD